MEVETEIIVEEGEITDDSDDGIETYKILERPEALINSQKPQVIENFSDHSDPEPLSSDSDSDKGYSHNAKRSRSKKLPLPKPKKLHKYDVWSSRAQEDLLTETLVSCDVSKIDRSLGVESYDYTKSNRYKDEMKFGRNTNKRKHKDQKNVHLRLGKREHSKDNDKMKCTPRIILDLTTNADSSVEELAKDIANKLMEEKDELIYKIVNTVGKEKSIDLFKSTQKAEAAGGILIMNGTRRRTPGGVYIYLLKQDDYITMEQQNQIFSDERFSYTSYKKHQHKEKFKKYRSKSYKEKPKKHKNIAQKLPELPTRIELLEKEKNSSDEPVNNPPPSPASEDSSAQHNTSNERNLNDYSDEFLDIGIENDMDTF